MLQYGFMQRAFITGILLAVITPLIGITIVLKRMSMIGDALSHASLAGVALGLLLIQRWQSPSSCQQGSD